MMQRKLILSILTLLLCCGVADAKGKRLRSLYDVDRQINSGSVFGYKGEYMLGLTASYGTLSSGDSNLLVFLDDIDIDGAVTTVKPFFGYFYRDNRCFGLRMGYQYLDGNIGNLSLDLGEQNDISMSLGGMHLSNNSFSVAAFHRSYVAIDSKGQFGLFAEIEGSAQFGNGKFMNGAGEAAKFTKSDNLKLELGFSPGIAAYIFPSVCATVSIGLGGIRYSSIKQYDEAGSQIGSRTASKMQFKLNVADINFGMTLHLWNKKKMSSSR